jgi:CubicO group peptidase (beta-lactamase class C family)
MPFCALLVFAALSAPSSAQLPPQLTQQNLEMAANYSEAQDGVSILVLHKGQVVFERYPDGHSADEAHWLASGTKSFCGVMAAAAVQDGLLTLDERVCETIAEWKDDPLKAQVTIRQLLSLTSGIRPGSVGRPPTYAEAVESAVIDPPGTMFRYGPASFQIFGEVMRRKLAATNEDPLAYLKRRVFDPIGLQFDAWRKGKDGNAQWPSGAKLTAREWSKFGHLLLHKGEWNGKKLVDKDTLDACFKGNPANPMYGLSFWLPSEAKKQGAKVASPRRNRTNDISFAPGAPEIVMAAGALGQRLYVVPSMELVIIRQGTGPHFRDQDFLQRFFKGEAP